MHKLRRVTVIDQSGDNYLVEQDGVARIIIGKANIPKDAIWELDNYYEDSNDLEFEENYPELLEGSMGKI